MYTIYQDKPAFLHGFKNEDDDDVEWPGPSQDSGPNHTPHGVFVPPHAATLPTLFLPCILYSAGFVTPVTKANTMKCNLLVFPQQKKCTITYIIY